MTLVQTKVCFNCKNQNYENALVCSVCGTVLNIPSANPIKKPIVKRSDGTQFKTKIQDETPRLVANNTHIERIDIHSFLNHCILLKNVAVKLKTQLACNHFDGYAFFLRGGFPLFAYLNEVASLQGECNIFGGLTHKQYNSQKFLRWLKNLFVQSNEVVNVFIADEAKSGSGINKLIKDVKAMMKETTSGRLQLNLDIFAIRHFDVFSIKKDKSKRYFTRNCEKWNQRESNAVNGNSLNINVTHFEGCLLTYDNKIGMCGIEVNTKTDSNYDYDRVSKYALSLLLFCPSNSAEVFSPTPSNMNLTQYFDLLVKDMWIHPEKESPKAIHSSIAHNGCSECKGLLDLLSAEDLIIIAN